MINSWFGWIGRRRHSPKMRSLRPRRDPRRRPPGVERLEDRLLLTTVAYAAWPDDGFIDIAGSDCVLCEGASFGGRVAAVFRTSSVNAPTGSSSTVQSSFVPDGSDSAYSIADSDGDMELIRIEPNPPSPSAPGDGLVDLTAVLNEPIAPADRQPSLWEHPAASVAANSDHTDALAPSEDRLAMTGASRGWAGFRLAALLSKHVGMNHRPAGDGLPWLDDSPSDEIEGARGISRTLEVATSPPDRAAPPAEPQDHAERLWPSAPLLHESVRWPHQPDGVPPGQEATDPGPWRAPEEPADLVAPRGPHSPTAHEAIFSEMAKPFGDAFFDAIYLDDKRPVHVITLVVAAALAQQLSDRSPSPDALTCLLPPRRRLRIS